MTPNPLPLAVVDSQTGELRAAGCSECAELAAKLAGREADLEALTEEFTRLLRKRDALLRDRERERELDPQRLVILEVWDYYREKCRHPNSKLDAHRFDLVKARLRQFTAAELKAAIDGAAVAAYVDADGKDTIASGSSSRALSASRTSPTAGTAGSAHRGRRDDDPCIGVCTVHEVYDESHHRGNLRPLPERRQGSGLSALSCSQSGTDPHPQESH